MKTKTWFVHFFKCSFVLKVCAVQFWYVQISEHGQMVRQITRLPKFQKQFKHAQQAVPVGNSTFFGLVGIICNQHSAARVQWV